MSGKESAARLLTEIREDPFGFDMGSPGRCVAGKIARWHGRDPYESDAVEYAAHVLDLEFGEMYKLYGSVDYAAYGILTDLANGVPFDRDRLARLESAARCDDLDVYDAIRNFG